MPQPGQGERARDFHEKKAQNGCAFMPGDQGIGHAGQLLDSSLSADATKKRRQRQQGHDSENDKRGSLELVVLPGEGDQEQAKADDGSNNREMIEQEVQMCQI